MLALYRSGRQAEALDAYRDARRLLVEELGIEPGPSCASSSPDPRAGCALELTAPRAADRWPRALVGRDRDLADLLPVIDGALAGSGAVVLLAGEPGIGKSRLAEALAAHAHQRGASVAVGRCWETGGAPAFWPWVQALGSQIRQTDPALVQDLTGPDAADLAAIVPELHASAHARSADAEGSRFRLFGAVAAYLRRAAAHQPVTLFLDDLHAADLPSLLLLRFVAAEVPRGRILIVGCYRDTEPRSDLNEILPDLVREPAVHHHALRPLTSEGMAQVLELVTGAEPEAELVEHVHARTEGNPLFAVEIGRLLRTAADAAPGSTPIPSGVTETIHRRVSGRSERCRETLVVARYRPGVRGRRPGAREHNVRGRGPRLP